jgi:hypothetical protein
MEALAADGLAGRSGQRSAAVFPSEFPIGFSAGGHVRAIKSDQITSDCSWIFSEREPTFV